MNPLVSIIIPYYNRQKKLQRAIDSIFGQTYPDFEIIIVDDNSKERLYFEQEKISYVRSTKNLGPGVSRNIGLKKAKGDYIVFLDSDDYWDKNFLISCVIAFKKSPDNTVMVYTNTLGFNEQNVLGNKRYRNIKDTKILPTILQRGRPWETSACMWDFKKIKNISWINARNWEDYAFDVAVAVKYNDIVPINKNLVFYDESGTDKLSLQDNENSIIEKSKAISYISDTLKNSIYYKDLFFKNRVALLIINNIISLMSLDVSKKNEHIHKNIENLKAWKSSFFVNVIKVLINVRIKIGLPLLRRIRNNMQKSYTT